MNNFEKIESLSSSYPDKEGPESLKSHNITVSNSQDLQIIVNTYKKNGWEVKEMNELSTKLEKEISTIIDTTSRMFSRIITLKVNITVE